MQRPDQHEIDSAAQRLVEQALPLAWVARKQEPDYGIDYVVEVFAGGMSTGRKFDVQLNGTRAAQVRGEAVCYSLETAHLKYYLKLREPVFLVVADVTTGKAVWLFLQKYTLETLATSRWRTQKTVTIRIPVENSLANTATFLDALVDADRYMAGVHPAALAEAIAATRRKLESKDPRFGVRVRVNGDAIGYEFLAKEEVRATLRFTGTEDSLHQTLEDFLGKGKPIDFAAGTLSVEGLPALHEAAAHGGTLQWARHFPASLHLAALDAAGAEYGRMDALTGEFVGGLKETTLRARLGVSPLEIGFTITADDRPTVGAMRVSFQIERWAGQSLLHLDHFDQLHSVFGIGALSPHLVIRCFLRSNHLLTASSTPDREGVVSGICWIIRALHKARAVADRLNVSPILPADVTDEDLHQAEALHAVLFGGGFRRPAEGERITLTVDRPKTRNIRRALDGTQAATGRVFTLSGGPHEFPFFRSRVNVDRVSISLTHAHLDDAADVKTRLTPGKPIALTWVGGNDAELVIKTGEPTDRSD